MTTSSLSGRVIAITGAGRGIGAATARLLHAAGAKVAIGDLDLATAEATAAAIGPDVVAYPLDVTDYASFDTFLDKVEADLGPLDVLVNNAGIMVVGSFLDEDVELADKQLAINLNAVVYGSRSAARRMRSRGRGHLVNVASAAGKIGFVGVSTYCASKFGVVGLSEALRRELAGTGVKVSCVMPGIVNTELAAGLEKNPVLRTVEPEEIAEGIKEALESGRFAVYRPAMIPLMVRLTALTPVGLTDRLIRMLGGDHAIMSAAGSSERRKYIQRTET